MGGGGDVHVLRTESLFSAVENGHLNEMKRILDDGTDVNSVRANDETPLMCATLRSHGTTNMLQTLLDRGADIHFPDGNGDTVIMLASRCGAADAVRVLLASGADCNSQNHNGLTSLLHAVIHRKLECAQLLLEAGADVNASRNDGKTALMLATRTSSVAMISLLLSYDAKVDAKTPTGCTALMYASNVEVATALLDGGASVNIHDHKGVTPLIFAAMDKHTCLARHLITRGADPALATLCGKTALICSAWQGDFPTTSMLLDKGADPNARTKSGSDALMFASSLAHVGCVRLLLEAGASVTARNDEGLSALHIAARSDQWDTALENIYPRLGNDVCTTNACKVADLIIEKEPRLAKAVLSEVIQGALTRTVAQRCAQKARECCLALRMNLWRGIARSAGVFGLAQIRSAQRLYAPGGAQYDRIRAETAVGRGIPKRAMESEADTRTPPSSGCNSLVELVDIDVAYPAMWPAASQRQPAGRPC
jgi:ankyrin repeat protein